jgi:hypothetical protein
MTASGGGITIETMNIKSGVDWEFRSFLYGTKIKIIIIWKL